MQFLNSILMVVLFLVMGVAGVVMAFAVVGGITMLILEQTPYGAQSVMDERQEAIEGAYANGQYAEVVRLYQTEVDVPLGRDIPLAQHRNWINGQTKLDRPFHLMMGDSYRELGHSSIAEEHYLRALGWDRDQYRAYCALHNDCHDLSTIARR